MMARRLHPVEFLSDLGAGFPSGDRILMRELSAARVDEMPSDLAVSYDSLVIGIVIQAVSAVL
ncbi:hypothetical protein Pan44_45220 [Caulifigura coniformis]|uniref:Uncharacterized protein n=1 Tax=Caulifigura coniformis TaxID=2527983 RepID=A0A517SK20_9PLAN|nr:hypothetical protein Pan44_45220 [Caulifigura coniformis]